MSNKINYYLKFFIGGLISGISFYSVIFLPLIFLGHYFLIKGLLKKNILILNFFAGWLFGLGFFLTSMHWIINPFLIYEKHLLLAPLIFIIFPSFMGLFFTLPCILITKFVSLEKINEKFYFQAFLITFFLFISELFRSKLFGGLPFNLYAHLWIFNEYFIKIVSFIGVFGLSFLTTLWIVLTVLFIMKQEKKFIITLIFLPIILVSFSMLNENKSLNGHETIDVRVVQPNIPQKEKWDRSLFQKHIDKIIALSSQGGGTKQLVVIWPEVAMTVFLNEHKNLIDYIKKKLDDDTIIITGGLRRVFDGDSFKIFNSIYVIQKDKVIFYDKKRLVPFGEFIPLRFILDIIKLTPGDTDFSKGEIENSLTIKFENKKIIFEPSICYEAIFQTFNYKKVDLIVNITNDAWFGNTTGPKQHLNASIFRSVEKGVPLIRSANSGISVITDINGKILKKLELNKTGFVESKVTLGNNSTFFMKYKNKVVIYLIFIIFIMHMLADFLIKKRKSLKINR